MSRKSGTKTKKNYPSEYREKAIKLITDWSTLKMALMQGRKIASEEWLHSDRGVQFASEAFRDLLRLTDIEQSMCRASAMPIFHTTEIHRFPHA